MPRNGTGPSSLSITERRLGECSVQIQVVSMTRPRKRRVSVTSTPGRSGPLRWGRTAIRLLCQRGRLAGCARNAKTSSGGRRISAVCSKWSSWAELRPDPSGNRYGARGGAGRRNAARTPARGARRQPRWRSTRARRSRCSPCSRWPTGRGRATCSPSCCGPSTTPSTRGARCGGRCRRCARPSGPTSSTPPATRSASSAAPGSPSTSTASARWPRTATWRAPRRCSAASSWRASGSATRPSSRTGSAPRPTRCGASSRRCWRGWWRRPATSRSRSAGSSSTRCTSPRTGR